MLIIKITANMIEVSVFRTFRPSAAGAIIIEQQSYPNYM